MSLSNPSLNQQPCSFLKLIRVPQAWLALVEKFPVKPSSGFVVGLQIKWDMCEEYVFFNYLFDIPASSKLPPHFGEIWLNDPCKQNQIIRKPAKFYNDPCKRRHRDANLRRREINNHSSTGIKYAQTF